MRRRFSWWKVPVTAAVLALALSGEVRAELWISEYVEGSSNNKAVELYNPGPTAVDLSLGGYSLQLFLNGSATASSTINLTGVIAAGGSFVIAHTSAVLPGVTVNQTSGSLSFNGDDALTLRHNTTVIDSVGQVGLDPGTEWGSGVTSTADNTIRRKTAICAGDAVTNDAFNPATQWDGFAIDTFAGLGSHVTACGGSPATDLLISEYVEGSSNNKAVEIYNPTGGSIALSTYAVLIYFNGSATPASTINLSGTLAAGGTYVIAHSSAVLPGITVNLSNGSLSHNGDDAIVLRKNGTTVVDSLGQVGVDPGTEWGSGVTSTADNTIRRKSTVCAGDTNPNDAFNPATQWDGFAVDTFGGLNIHTASCAGGVTNVEIWQIQGSGDASPLAGQIVTTRNNLVTATGPDGFFLQTPAARSDGNAATSDGIWVFTAGAPTVAAGALVDVTGTVAEFNGLTELTFATVTQLSSGNPLPASATLNPPTTCAAGTPFLERFEGMRVKVVNGTVAGPTDRFGDTAIVGGTSRPYREPGILCPGLGGLPVWDGNPEIFEVDPDRLGLPNADLAGGAVITLIEGGLGFAFGDYQIWPTTVSVVGSATPGPVRARAAGEFTVGGQNFLRLFDTVDDPAVDDEIPTAQAYADRLAKFSLHVRTVLRSPEILAVSEVENLGVLQDLAARIQTDDPAVAYTAYLQEGNDVGGIDVGFLVRSSVTVGSVVQWAKTDTYTFGGQTLTLNDRPPLILTGTYNGCTGSFPITVIAVHQRSLGSIEDPTDGPRVREKRHQQALRLSQFIQTQQLANPNLRLVVIGDFNAFQFTDGYVDVMGQMTGNLDPLGALVPGTDEINPNLTNQILSEPAAQRYSFVFDGTAQTLDHALTSAALNPFVRGLEHSRGNADAPNSFSALANTPLRSSDHDGLVLYLGCTALP